MVIIFIISAAIGLLCMVMASFIGIYIVKTINCKFKDQNKVKNLFDFYKIADKYSKETGDNVRVILSYSLSTIGGILFVASFLAIFIILKIPK